MTTETIPMRKMNELLTRGTYQGMSDEEIDAVLDYRIKQAVSAREMLVMAAAEQARVEQVIADNRAAAQASLDMLQSIVERDIPEIKLMQPTRFKARGMEE